mmetsp:Transcript_56148/g.127638  ORF Transcript_56148/g.127638 Transcript_56148/m.127638 type:complete len:134 (-) Transcript_56148:7-408(-)
MLLGRRADPNEATKEAHFTALHSAVAGIVAAHPESGARDHDFMVERVDAGQRVLGALVKAGGDRLATTAGGLKPSILLTRVWHALREAGGGDDAHWRDLDHQVEMLVEFLSTDRVVQERKSMVQLNPLGLRVA